MKIGSLCSGYGGLDLAAERYFDAETAWFAEFDPAPSKVLAAHWPDVPNLRDITTVDWASVEPVDILTGGTPCQDLSAAGRRRGMTEGTRSNLWVQMREAIAVIRPAIVVWENVRGAYSARADSAVESEPGLLGEWTGRPPLRALGRVLGDLSELGFDAEWVGIRAADAGAPHGRFRVFVVAHASSVGHGDTRPPSVAGIPAAALAGDPQDADVAARGQRRVTASGQAPGGRTRADSRGRGRTSAVTDAVGDRRERWGDPGDLAAEAGARESAEDQRERYGHAADDRGSTAPDSDGFGREGVGRVDAVERDSDGRGRPHIAWGDYEPAIRRWERALGRVAPAPTDGRRLSPMFVEWMMGLPAGWVTSPDVGLTRNEQLRALGNGVVPQQAELAFRMLEEATA
jgi:DNA (cytosine-5)-methyltransferase 1